MPPPALCPRATAPWRPAALRRFVVDAAKEGTLEGFGFGFEKLGLVVVRFPRLFAAALLVSLAACLWAVPSLTFNGNILNVLSPSSQAYRDYRHVQADFRDFSGDLGVIVRSDSLYTPEGLRKLRDFHLDLSLVDGVDNVASLFSSIRFDPRTGALEPAIPEEIPAGADARRLVEDAAGRNPLIAQLSRPEKNAALIFLETRFTEMGGAAPDPEAVDALVAEIGAVAPQGMRIDFVGYPLLRANAVAAIVAEEMKLTLIGIAMVFVIAIITFRAPLPALICSAPAVASVVWVLGSYALAGASIDYLSIALPTIAMVLALADGVMLYFGWAAFRREGLSGAAAVRAALRRVGPANSMTSITTALAFASFALGGNPALKSLALLGSSAVIIAFVAVMVIMPLLLLALGDRSRTVSRPPFFQPAGPIAARLARWRPAVLSAFAIAVMAACGIGHFTVREQHRITNQLPADSPAAQGERLAADLFGGVAPIYLTLPVPPGMAWHDEAALATLAKAEHAFAKALGGKVFSLATVHAAGLGGEELKRQLAQADASLRGRFLSADLSEYLVTGSAPYGMDPQSAVAAARGTVAALEREGIHGARVTGYPILAALEIPAIIGSLRQNLLAAILLGVGVIALASRRPLVAAAAIAPNMIPVLFIESALSLLGQPMDIAHIIALTIAFGISIDNAVHVINAFLANAKAGMDDLAAMESALREVAPGLVSATVMFVAGSIGTTVSSLPSVRNLGILIIATLCVALVANLAFLPAMMLTFRRFRTKLK